MAEPPPLESLEQFVGLLAAVRAQIESAGARLETAGQALESEGGAAEAAISGFAAALTAAAERLEGLEQEGAAAVRAWTEAVATGLGGPLAEAEPRFGETDDRFGHEVAEGRQVLERERAGWVEELGELGSTLEALEGEVSSLVLSTDQAFTGFESALAHAGEVVEGVATESEAEMQALGGLASGDLLGIVEGSVQGLSSEATSRLAPADENPLGVLGRGALTRLEESTDAGLVFGHNTIERCAELLDGVAPHWAQTREATASAADQAREDRGAELKQELEEVGTALHQGVDVTAGYTPVLPQLPPVRDGVEKISEMLDAMNPFA